MIKFNYLLGLLLICLVSTSATTSESEGGVPVNYIRTAEEFITAVKNKDNTEVFIKTFEYCKLEQLANQVATDDQRLAFWINLYNAYIQVILTKEPGLYKDRNAFFKKKQINIGGKMFSFSDIEHGILRRSQNEYFLGYILKFFPSKPEKMFRVDKVDWRIHFALNCGAKSCPPIRVYYVDEVRDQLELAARTFLSQYTKYDPIKKSAKVTALFTWFQGDFGGYESIKKILVRYKLIPDTKTELVTETYDWTLKLANFADNGN